MRNLYLGLGLLLSGCNMNEFTTNLTAPVLYAAATEAFGYETDTEFVRQAAPGNLVTLAGFLYSSPNSRYLLHSCAQGFAEWGLLPRVAELDGVEHDLAILGLRLPAGTAP